MYYVVNNPFISLKKFNKYLPKQFIFIHLNVTPQSEDEYI